MNPTPKRARAARESNVGRRAAVAATLALAATAVPLRAQIVNTLRGWSDPEPGWSGEVEGRFALSEGNAEYLELSAAASVQLVAGRHRIRALASETLRRAAGEEIAEDFLVHLRHNLRLTAALSTLLFVQNQYNPFRRLERRTLVGAGGRWDVVRVDSWNAALGAAYMYESEVLTEDPEGVVDTDHRFSFFASLVGRVTQAVRADIAAFHQPLVGDFSDSRAFASARVRTDLVGELDLIVAFTLYHDAEPAEGVEPTDLTLSSGLVLSF